MIATLLYHGSVWLDRDGKLLVQLPDVPFAVNAVVCVCHGKTWRKGPNGSDLIVV